MPWKYRRYADSDAVVTQIFRRADSVDKDVQVFFWKHRNL